MIETPHFKSSAEVFAALAGFINLERGQTGKSFRLDRMELLAREAGRPELFAPAVHVAGSKGKGSVTTMISSVLDAAGLRTARYVSPHVTDYRERVSFARGPFPEELYAASGDELMEVLDRAVSSGGGLPGGEEPTFFELMTLFFFLCCRKARCEAAVVETGMGGRLDATNIVMPLVSVITPIELEHVDYLGRTIAAIAGEKAGIIKEGRPVIVSSDKPEAVAVFRETARLRSAPLRLLSEEVRIENIAVDRDGTSARLVFADSTLFRGPLDLRLGLVGAVQAENAAQAALAVRTAYPDIADDRIAEGLARADLPARFERIREDPLVVIDGAHTERSVALTLATFSALYGDGGILLFASAIDKDVAAMARILAPHFSRVFVTAPGTFKKSDPPSAHRAFVELGARSTLIADTGEAIRQAVSAASSARLPLLAVGSFYLAAEVRSALL